MTSKRTSTAAAAESNLEEDSPIPAKKSVNGLQLTGETGAPELGTTLVMNARLSDQIPINQRPTDEQVTTAG